MYVRNFNYSLFSFHFIYVSFFLAFVKPTSYTKCPSSFKIFVWAKFNTSNQYSAEMRLMKMWSMNESSHWLFLSLNSHARSHQTAHHYNIRKHWMNQWLLFKSSHFKTRLQLWIPSTFYLVVWLTSSSHQRWSHSTEIND